MNSPSPLPPTKSPAPAAPVADLAGETMGDFRIYRQLGQGGMGHVYLAEQISLRRKVAIKLLRDDIASNPTALERFRAESKIVARLSHANVVQVYMIGEHEGRHYMVLEYVEGVSLRDYLLRKGPLDVPLVFSIMRQVAGALNRASELGVIHRDIKPENILITRKGEVKVADFGLSQCLGLDQPLDLTRSGTTVGTPLYMSPEQVEGKAVDQRSDIYSFGVTCYQLLAGRPPFLGGSAYEVALKHVREEAVPLEVLRADLPPALCAVVRKMMGKTRRARYQSARDLLKDIAQARESLGATTGTLPAPSMVAEPVAVDKPAPPTPKRSVSLRLGLALAAGVFVAALCIGAAILWSRPAARIETPPPVADAAPPIAPAPALTTPPADPTPPSNASQEREITLRKSVDENLKQNSPNPSGVEACMDLGALYLDQNRVAEAEGLFGRMSERKAPSAYYFVGRLGLAVTDALNNDSRASHDKFKELFDAKSRDNRAQILNDYLAKSPEFAKWVNEADSSNVRNGAHESALPQQDWRHFPFVIPGKSPFHRP